MSKFHPLDTTSIPMLKFIEENPMIAVRDIAAIRGMHYPQVQKIIARLHKMGLIHVGGYCDLKRRRARLWVYGPGEDEKYPKVPKSKQIENQRRLEKEYQERQRIRRAAQSGGAFGAMAAQLMRN